MQDQLELKKIDSTLILSIVFLLWLVIAPHFFHLKIKLLLLFTGLVCWRALGAFYPKLVPSKLFLFVITIAILFIYWRWYRLPIGQNASIALLVMMIGLKVLEIKVRRDLYITLFLGYFAIITQFLFNTDILFSLYQFLILFALTFVLLQMNQVSTKILWKSNFKIVAFLLAQAIPIGIIFFVLFPRINGPLWSFKMDEKAATGLSDHLNPGSISNLSQSDALAFRATFKNKTPPSSELYWRGPVLWDTDGQNWTVGKKGPAYKMSFIGRGVQYQYDISLEATNRNWLFVLDLPSIVPKDSYLTRGYRLMTKDPITQRKNYSATSYTDFNNLEMNTNERRRALKLPENITPRVLQFAKKMLAQSQNSEQALEKILDYFNQQNFYYTLRPPKLGANPTDQFLFETQKGFCGHYSTSFTILARAMGLPARVVTGYQGGEYNPQGHYYMIRQRHAHAWVEVWLDKQGWVRFDPTAAVAPERIQNDFEFDENGAAVQFNLDSKSFFGRFAMKTRWMLDAVQVSWQKWVVGFDDNQQQSFLKKIGLNNWELEKIIIGAIFSALFILTLSTLFFLYRDRVIQSPVVKIYQQWRRKLAKGGISSAGNEGPQHLANRIIQKRPDLALQVKPLIQSYIALRYAPPNRVQIKLFRRLVQQFKI